MKTKSISGLGVYTPIY